MRDVVVGLAGPIRHDTDTPARIDVHCGGSGANTALWLGHTGCTVSFVGRAGARDVPALDDHFRRFGVDPFIQPDEGHPTGTIVITVEGESRSMLTDRGANRHLDASAIPRAATDGVGFVHLTGYSFFHAEDPEVLGEFIARVRGSGARVSLDCSSVGFLKDFGIDRWWQALGSVDIVRGNAAEVKMITGIDDPALATAEIASRGHTAIITHGAKGAMWCEPGGPVNAAPAAALGPDGCVDSTGAGDAFSAGVLGGLSRGESVEQAVRRGLTLAATVVARWGAAPS